MIVYHGGYTSVVEPKIITPSRSLDFGSGFYATTSLEQAQKWSLIKKDRFQICFHTKKSLECLKYIKSEEVK